jgi:branched-chain amino acid transport system substrate-binding protein
MVARFTFLMSRRNCMKFATKLLAASVAAAALTLSAGAAMAQAGETVKIAVIDPFSGPQASIGLNILHTIQLVAEREGGKNNAAGVKFEVISIDNKASPAETLNAFKAATDQGIRYVVQGGSGSGAAGALIDAINKYNDRNVGKEVVYFNYAAMDPGLTNERCSFWHFRFDADTSMKMEAIAAAIKDNKDVKNVYLMNQNFVHGQQVAKYAKETLARKAPNVKIVGEDLTPLFQVKDFAPYIAKIKAAGADTVITGNFGPDMSLLFKAAKDAGLNVTFYTYYAGAAGGPTAMGDYGLGKVRSVYGSYSNQPGEYKVIQKAFADKFPKEAFANSAIYHMMKMLPAAMAKAKSTDPVKVAKAMENLTVKSMDNDVTMRGTDHQLQAPLYVFTWNKVDAKNTSNMEGTGNTFTLDKKIESYTASTPTTCQMKRPS